jgi:hypothetical protein
LQALDEIPFSSFRQLPQPSDDSRHFLLKKVDDIRHRVFEFNPIRLHTFSILDHVSDLRPAKWMDKTV